MNAATIRTIKRASDCQKFVMTLAAHDLAAEYGVEYIGMGKNGEGYYVELSSGYYAIVTNGAGEYDFLADAGQMVFGVVVDADMYDELMSGGGKLAA